MVINAVAGKIDSHDGEAGHRGNFRQKLGEIGGLIRAEIEDAARRVRVIEGEQDPRHHIACIGYVHAVWPAVFIARQYMRRFADIPGL